MDVPGTLPAEQIAGSVPAGLTGAGGVLYVSRTVDLRRATYARSGGRRAKILGPGREAVMV